MKDPSFWKMVIRFREGFCLPIFCLSHPLLSQNVSPDLSIDLSITNPTVLIGLFFTGMLSFLFAALSMDAVGKAAQSIIFEVRR